MSLLRDVLKRGKHAPNSPDGPGALTSKRSIKKYASSVKSSGGASMRSLADSVFSFYSAVTGSGPRVPKRRRADVSRLGVPPEWYADDPPPAPLMDGTAAPPACPGYTTAHAEVMHATETGDKPWLGLVLYSHAPPSAAIPMYHNAAKVAGEVRMTLDKPTSLSRIDVWFIIKSDSVVDMFKPPVLSMTACVWSRKKGDPRAGGGAPFKGKFPAGTFVFPFEFPALPSDTVVKHPDEERRKNKARVPLPPTYTVAVVGGFSGTISYTVGVNVTREGLGAIDEEFDVPVQYLPLARALPRTDTPFPYLPTREDWPLTREVVGGWTLTPFGGRGRLGDELVELEGVLGIPSPAVYTAGQTLPFTLLLWSASPLALEALAQPGAVETGLYKSDLFATDVLHPRNAARKNRRLERLVGGRVWRAEGGRPMEGAAEEELKLASLPEAASPATGASPVRAKPSRMQQVWSLNEEGDTEGGDTKDGENRAASPTPSLEDLDGLPDTECVVRLDGELRVPACSHPSFRYASMGREYVLHVLIRHPQYAHISPSGTGIIGEAPLWYVLSRFANAVSSVGQQTATNEGETQGDAETQTQTDEELAALPVKGATLSVGADAVQLPRSVGVLTTEKRPTFRVQRVAAF
ncbi:hypothetical protein B0H10DRAFT_751497 [Mycena sp. CBHHK59/15]|nr:hypothetical protein B0H10DRAFT_751497 [Mycena sp. CBHHK59/15]